MSAYDCMKTVRIMIEAYRLLAHANNKRDEISKWIKYGTQTVRLLRSLLHRNGASVAEKQKFISTAALIKGVQDKLRHLLKRGGNVQLRERRSDRVVWQDLEHAFNERVRSGVITNIKNLDITAFMRDARALVQTRIRNALKKEEALKVYTVLAAEYVITKADEEIVEIKYFNTKSNVIQKTTDLKEWFTTNVQQPLQKDMEEFQERDSGWTLRAIVNLCVHFNKYNPMRGSSYISLPMELQKKHACINVKNFDDQCFKWAVLSALHPQEHHSYRVSAYKLYEDELDFTGIQFPVMPKQIPKFEKQNNMSINVYSLKKRNGKFVVVPLHVTNCEKKPHVNLLLLQNNYVDEEKEEDNNYYADSTPPMYHYLWIKDLSRLVSNQLSKRNHKHFICNRCLHYFRSEQKLKSHEEDCSQLNKYRVNLPKITNNTLQFKNFNYKEKVPYVIYGDFECLLRPVHDDSAKAYQKHEAFSIGYYLKCSYDDSLSYYRSYRGVAPAKWFTEELKNLAKHVENVFKSPMPMEKLTIQQEIEFQKATVCHICEKPLSQKRVRDHCHLTGR